MPETLQTGSQCDFSFSNVGLGADRMLELLTIPSYKLGDGTSTKLAYEHTQSDPSNTPGILTFTGAATYLTAGRFFLESTKDTRTKKEKRFYYQLIKLINFQQQYCLLNKQYDVLREEKNCLYSIIHL